MLAEDLAQEARLAVWCDLQRDPDVPLSHLVVAAKHATHARCNGAAASIPATTRERTFHYSFTHLDAPCRDSAMPQHEVFTQTQDGTAPLALARVLHAHVHALLDAEQREALEMRLSGYGWDEIGEELYGESRLALTAAGLSKTEA